MRSLVFSVLMYACETWTLTADIMKKLQATEMRCFRKLLGISYRDHITNDAVRDRIRQAIGPYDDILTTVKKRKLKWFGHVSRSAARAKTILQGTVQGGRRRGRQKKRWENNISEWTGLRFCNALREAENKIIWRERVAMSVAPNGHHDYGIGAWSISHITHKKRLLPSVRVLLLLSLYVSRSLKTCKCTDQLRLSCVTICSCVHTDDI